MKTPKYPLENRVYAERSHLHMIIWSPFVEQTDDVPIMVLWCSYHGPMTVRCQVMCNTGSPPASQCAIQDRLGHSFLPRYACKPIVMAPVAQQPPSWSNLCGVGYDRNRYIMHRILIFFSLATARVSKSDSLYYSAIHNHIHKLILYTYVIYAISHSGVPGQPL